MTVRERRGEWPDRLYPWGSVTPGERATYLANQMGVAAAAARGAMNAVRIVFELTLEHVEASTRLRDLHMGAFHRGKRRPAWKHLVGALRGTIEAHSRMDDADAWKALTITDLARVWQALTHGGCEPMIGGVGLCLCSGWATPKSELASLLVALSCREELGAEEMVSQYWDAADPADTVVVAALDAIQPWVYLPRGLLRPLDLLPLDPLEYEEVALELRDDVQRRWRLVPVSKERLQPPLGDEWTVDDFVRQALRDYCGRG